MLVRGPGTHFTPRLMRLIALRVSWSAGGMGMGMDSPARRKVFEVDEGGET